jgi:DNA modification methylase
MLAAELTGRRCCGIEINPAYVSLAINRWEQMTGKRARLVTRGRHGTSAGCRA